MMHTLVVGRTMQGKTTYLKRSVSYFKKMGFNVLVLDSLKDPNWGADYVTDEAAQFIKVAKANRNCILIIDESGDSCGHWDKENFWLATQSRHWGHSSFFASQRPQMIAPTVRTQTAALVCFRISKSDARILADEMAEEMVLEAPTLGKGEYIYCPPHGSAKKFKLF